MSNTDGPQSRLAGLHQLPDDRTYPKQEASLNRQRVRRIDTLRPRTLMQSRKAGLRSVCVKQVPSRTLNKYVRD
jgi:hypothetical protein